MNYEEYLQLFNELKESSLNVDIINRLKNIPLNANIQEMLEPKYIDIINYKLSNSISRIKNELGSIFDNVNYLDMSLVNFKKEINYIKELSTIKILTQAHQEEINNNIKLEIEKVYNILIKEANIIDPTGIYALTIKNNEIKWS